MFVVAFEESIPADRSVIAGAYYLRLLHILQNQYGFISERSFTSPKYENKHLLLAKFKDEEAAEHWRMNEEHLRIQHQSRRGVFQHYRIRVGSVIPPEDYRGLANEVIGQSGSDPNLINVADDGARYLLIFEELKRNQTVDLDMRLALSDVAHNHKGYLVDIYENADSIVSLATRPSRTSLMECLGDKAWPISTGWRMGMF